MQVFRNARIFRLFSILLLLLVTSLWFEACGTGKLPEKPECQKNSDCAKKGKGYYCNRRSKKCVLSTCNSSADCANGETCKNSACVTSGTGTTENPTGNGEGNGGTDAGSPENPAADPGSSCQGGKKSCKGKSECASGEECNNGCCQGPCTSNAECGTSSTTCQATDNCSSSKVKICVAGKCVESACQCQLGSSCDATSGQCQTKTGKCPDGSTPDPKTGKCPVKDKCATTQCPAGQAPDSTANCKCIKVKKSCEACTSKAECGSKGHCYTGSDGNKICVEDCSANGTCSDAGNYDCLNLGSYKACVPKTKCPSCDNSKCKAGTKCCAATDACQECCGNSDCKAPQVCHNVLFKCVAPDPCSGVTCQGRQTCNPQTGKCEGKIGNCKPVCTGGNKCCPGTMGTPARCAPKCGGGGAGACSNTAQCKAKDPKSCCFAMLKICIPAIPGFCAP